MKNENQCGKTKSSGEKILESNIGYKMHYRVASTVELTLKFFSY